jgi:hypothetical protein
MSAMYSRARASRARIRSAFILFAGLCPAAGGIKIVHAPDTVARMTAAGSIPVGNTPEQFGAYIKQEITRYAKLVKAYGIKAD